jgi:hypothetical protein
VPDELLKKNNASDLSQTRNPSTQSFHFITFLQRFSFFMKPVLSIRDSRRSFFELLRKVLLVAGGADSIPVTYSRIFDVITGWRRFSPAGRPKSA